jgi:DNA mismatch repair ATPase MutS
MKAHLMYRNRDFEPAQKLPWNAEAVIQDLELNTLCRAMAGGDKFLFDVARQALFAGLEADTNTIRYRQAVLQDCLRNLSLVRSLYALAIEALENKSKTWFGIIASYPSSVLYSSVQLFQLFVESLGKLRQIADEHALKFQSEGFTTFFSVIKTELTDDYLTEVRQHVKELELRHGVLVSAQLGKGNQGVDYVLRKSEYERPWWIERFFPSKQPSLTFRIADRDEAGARALSDIRNRGINLVANALAQSSDHVLNYFNTLRAELAFYLGCANLHTHLASRGVPICFPVAADAGTLRFSCEQLRDVSLVLSMDAGVVGNDLRADGKKLVVITGANKGGKSTFLRALGLAQLMMQCGMFVTAQSFTADVCRGLNTHYKREEDVSMKSGKLDEELSRMSEIVDALVPDSILLCNESFAATNEREGSEIANQIVRALMETPIKIFFVTHLYEFAHRLWEQKNDAIGFLRAGREADGRRIFKLLPGEPLQTSFGPDLYDKIFEQAGYPDEPVPAVIAL